MVVYTSPDVLRITSHWNWNPVSWSWYTYEMPVHTKHNGKDVIGTVTFKQRGPFHETKVTYP